LDFCAKTGHQPEHAWTCWGLAAALIERGGAGDRQPADELLKEALQVIIDLGMAPLRERVENLMSQAGQPPPLQPIRMV